MSIRLVIAVIAVILALPGGAGAQELPVAPDPALCTLDPRTIEEIEDLVDAAANQPEDPTPTPVAVPFEMPDGFSLVEEERSEIEKDLLRAISCINTGNPLQVFSTYSDRYVVQLVEQLGGMTDEVISGLLTVREITEAQWLRVTRLDDAILLHDGRALVIVTGDNPADALPAGPRAFYLQEVMPGRWLVDEIVEITMDSSG